MSHFTEALYLKRKLNQLINENTLLFNHLKMLSEVAPPPPPWPPALAPDIDAPRNVSLDAEAPFQLMRTNFQIPPEYVNIWQQIVNFYSGNQQSTITQWFNNQNVSYIIRLFEQLGIDPNSPPESILPLITSFDEMWKIVSSLDNMSMAARLRMFREILNGRQLNTQQILDGLNEAQYGKLNELITQHLSILQDLLDQINEDLQNISLDNLFREALLARRQFLERLIRHWTAMQSNYLGELMGRLYGITSISNSTFARLREQMLAAKRAANAVLNNPNSTPEQISRARAVLNSINNLLQDFSSGINNMQGPARLAWFAAAATAIISLWEILQQEIQNGGQEINFFLNSLGEIFQGMMNFTWPNNINAIINIFNWLHQSPYVSGAGSVEGSESGGSIEFPYEFPYEYP